MNKSELRKIYLERQRKISSAHRKHKSEQIIKLFFEVFDLSGIQKLHCFMPIAKFNEINTRLIFERIWGEFPEIWTVVPRVNFQTDEIENVKITAQTKLAQNLWQIDEPKSDETVETKVIDLILVPLICFDENGFRVGYGKGFYDKLLKNCRRDCLKIGLSYFEPIEQIDDVQDFDIKLDFCVTPEKVWRY